MGTFTRRSNRHIGDALRTPSLELFALLRALYTDIESSIRYDRGRSEFFPEPTGGSKVVPSLRPCSVFALIG